jgi:hypothetical protein
MKRLMYTTFALALGVMPIQAQADIITFDGGFGGGGSYSESGMTITSTDPGGLLIGDNNSDGSMDLHNSSLYLQPIKFTNANPFTLDYFFVVGRLGLGDARGLFESNLGGSFIVDAKGPFQVALLPLAQQALWMGITEFTWTQYQFNNVHGAFDIDDINFTLCNGTCSAPQPLATPEPTSVALLGSGLVGLATWRLRQKRA